MAVQTVLSSKVDVEFSPKLFCKFLRCSECGVYVYRVDNKLGLYIGGVVPYTFLKGKVVCMGCCRG
jgi:hypothetical protein